MSWLHTRWRQSVMLTWSSAEYQSVMASATSARSLRSPWTYWVQSRSSRSDTDQARGYYSALVSYCFDRLQRNQSHYRGWKMPMFGCLLVLLFRSALWASGCWSGGTYHAQVLPVWRHCEHCSQDGVHWPRYTDQQYGVIYKDKDKVSQVVQVLSYAGTWWHTGLTYFQARCAQNFAWMVWLSSVFVCTMWRHSWMCFLEKIYTSEVSSFWSWCFYYIVSDLKHYWLYSTPSKLKPKRHVNVIFSAIWRVHVTRKHCYCAGK